MPFYRSFAEVMTFALFYRINTELGNIFTTDNITSISKCLNVHDSQYAASVKVERTCNPEKVLFFLKPC